MCDGIINEIERLRNELHLARDWSARVIAGQEESSAEIERLRAALRPFAEAADGFDMTRIKNPEEWFAYRGIVSSTESKGAITVGDLRRARAALDGQPAPGKEEASAEIERLRAALRWIDEQRYTNRSTISPENAYERALWLNNCLIIVMDHARAALKGGSNDAA